MGCSSILKILSIIFNLISLVMGACVTLFGIFQYWVVFFNYLSPTESEINELRDHFSIFNTEYIIIGTIICLVSIFGLISVATKNIFFLKLHAAIDLIIAGCLIITSLICFMTFEGTITKFMEKFIAVNFNHDKYNEMGEVIDAIQRLFRCCGDTGKENYYAEVLPSSCCWNENCSSGIVYDGCNTKVPKMVVDLGWPIFGIQNLCFIAIAAIAGVIKLLGGILALIILHCDKKNRE